MNKNTEPPSILVPPSQKVHTSVYREIKTAVSKLEPERDSDNANLETAVPIDKSEDPMTDDERIKRDQLIITIMTGLDAAIESGEALLHIRSHRLFRETHETFNDWCSEVLDLTEQRVSHLIKQAEDVQKLIGMGVDTTLIPATERGIRALRKVKNQENIVAVLQLAFDLGNSRPTGATVERARLQIEPETEKKSKESKDCKVTAESALKAAKTLQEFLAQDDFDDVKLGERRSLRHTIEAISSASNKLEDKA